MSGADVTTGATLVESRRHRITFATSRTLAYLSVLELGKVWERTLRRGKVPLKYSQGFNPRPRMHFAAPLPVGCGCDADLLDLLLETPWTSQRVRDAVAGLTPRDLVVHDVTAIDPQSDSLPDLLQEATYRVWLKETDEGALREAIGRFLAQDEVMLPKRGRKFRGRLYDLRSLVTTLTLNEDAPAPWCGLLLRVSARPGATGRPDELLRALGLSDLPRRITRTGLILSDPSAPD